MLTSDKVFNCRICAAQPVNQMLQGCFEPAPRPNVILKEYVFERCPITYQTPEGVLIYRAHQDGLLAASYETKVKLPAKLLAAVQHLDFLKRLREASDY